ncbi:MAG: DUF2208 family protein [Oscillospiraceae bacterium]|jgi:hypothetical protein|nr:DUF2208 family protein [Oscillospiraceae bacterium]
MAAILVLVVLLLLTKFSVNRLYSAHPNLGDFLLLRVLFFLIYFAISIVFMYGLVIAIRGIVWKESPKMILGFAILAAGVLVFIFSGIKTHKTEEEKA